ncbi:centlein [Elysia marginata]|uniref:Centlein n=1 Tax=Elysia marginata TaxID=1093978 RepID=A0AAV4GE48_9GAST|nr:centlein [Elysia marginata]
MRSEETKERSLEDNFRRTVEGTEKEKYELTRQVSRLTTDLEVAKSEKAHALNRQKILEERVRTLEREVSEKMVKFEELVKEVEDSSARLARYESQTSQQRRDLEFKNQELENVRKELKELWMAHNQLTEHSGQQADLIRQLQSLQQDTQKMMKNQEDAFTLESTSLQQMFTDVNVRYETAKRTEADLRQQVLELKKSLMDKDDIISSLHSQDAARGNSSQHLQSQGGAQPDYSGSFLDIVQEVDAIDSAPTYRSPRGRSLHRDPGSDSARGGSNSSRSDLSNAVLRSRSLSPPTRDGEPRGTEFGDVRKLAQLQKSLDLKERQVSELRRAHDNRLHRYQSLQSSFKLARQEIKNFECGRSPKAKKPKRADPRSLQKENSDQVWNELSFFKAENRTLVVDKMSLQEEVDLLRVQTSQDAATIHELRVAAQGHREEFEFQLRRLSRENKGVRETDKQLSILKSQVQNQTVHIEKLERDMVSVVNQRDDLIQEKSKLMSQLVSTQQEASKHRMELADVKHQLQSTRHEFEELMQAAPTSNNEYDDESDEKPKADIVVKVSGNLRRKKPKKGGNLPLSKGYQKSLNRSIENMSQMFDEFNDEGWEEISDSSDNETESETPSLGNRIVKKSTRSEAAHNLDKNKRKSKCQRVPTHRPPAPVKGVTSHLNSDEKARRLSPRSSKGPNSPKHQVARRECATSPIAFLSATVAPNAPSAAPGQREASRRGSIVSLKGAGLMRAKKVADLSHLRQRVPHLQQQVAMLKRAKAEAIKSQEELKEALVKTQTELSSVSGRLKAAKQHVQKLQTDNEKLQKEPPTTNSAAGAPRLDSKDDGDSQEIKVLEAKLKVANSEASRQAAALRTVKSDNESLQEQIRNLQDRINHLERDVNQKRNLLESQRIKMKHAQEMSKTEANNLEELQTKVKLLTESMNKSKVQMDSLKKRLTLAMKEKKEYEERFLKCSLELDHKGKQLLESNARRSGLESALAELEASAQQQLHALATQSEAAIDAAREKLTAAQTRLTQFHTMVKILSKEVITRTERARTKMREAKADLGRSQREGDPALQKAANKARDILNLSTSDMDDILSADGDADSQDSASGDDKKADKKWLKKCEKLMSSREDFVHALVTLMLQKMDERADLLIKLPR